MKQALLPNGQRVAFWTAAAVEERLREALRSLARLPVQGCFPERPRSAWPAPIQRAADWLPELGSPTFKQDYEHLQARIAEERHRQRSLPSAAAITRMEEALSWQHLVEPRRNFQVLVAYCLGEPARQTAERFGVARETLRRWRLGALEQIVRQLNRAPRQRR